jgi:hypothetical protein
MKILSRSTIQQHELIKIDIVISTILAGISLINPNLLNRLSFEHNIFQTDLHRFMSALTAYDLFRN